MTAPALRRPGRPSVVHAILHACSHSDLRSCRCLFLLLLLLPLLRLSPQPQSSSPPAQPSCSRLTKQHVDGCSAPDFSARQAQCYYYPPSKPPATPIRPYCRCVTPSSRLPVSLPLCLISRRPNTRRTAQPQQQQQKQKQEKQDQEAIPGCLFRVPRGLSPIRADWTGLARRSSRRGLPGWCVAPPAALQYCTASLTHFLRIHPS